MKKGRLYTIFSIRKIIKSEGIVFFPRVEDLPCFSDVDLVLLYSGVEWKEDGTFDTMMLEKDLKILWEKGYSHQICITSIMPFQQCEKFGVHYFPLDLCPLVFGCNLKLSFDLPFWKFLFRDCFHQEIKIDFVENVEVMMLIKTCENMANNSFYRELAIFCKKKGIRFPSVNTYPEKKQPMYLLEYMIRQMEDINSDCPLLFSCLFRQKYLDYH